jgi:hypothetical protein
MTPPTNRRVAAKKSAAASKPDPGSGSNGRRTPAKIEHPSHEERAAARDGSPPAVATRFAAEFLTTGRADPTHAPRKPGHHTGARLVPIGHGPMVASPVACHGGAALVMATDLPRTRAPGCRCESAATRT